MESKEKNTKEKNVEETKSQHMREIWFHVMSGGVMLKIVVMEIARITQMF